MRIHHLATIKLYTQLSSPL